MKPTKKITNYCNNSVQYDIIQARIFLIKSTIVVEGKAKI